MSIVTSESISKSIDKIDAMSEDALDKLIETFASKQETLLNYVMQAGVEYENEDLNAFSIYYFAIVLEAFLQEGIELNEVTDKTIEEFQEGFVYALEEINKNEDNSALFELVNQNNVMEFILNYIDDVDEEVETLEDETKTQLFIVTSGMIGLLNAAIKK
jgi:hypothetical protein